MTNVVARLLTERPQQVDLALKGGEALPETDVYYDMDVTYPPVGGPFFSTGIQFSCAPWAGTVVGQEDDYLIVRVTYDTETQLISTADMWVKPVWPATPRSQN